MEARSAETLEQAFRAMPELIENPITRKDRVHNRDVRQARADAEVVAQCAAEGVFAVRLGNLMGPEGNVYNVIGAVRAGIRWTEARGVVLPDEAYAIVNNYRERTYDQTIDMIERLAIDADGSIDALRCESEGNTPARNASFGDYPLGGFLGKGGGARK